MKELEKLIDTVSIINSEVDAYDKATNVLLNEMSESLDVEDAEKILRNGRFPSIHQYSGADLTKMLKATLYGVDTARRILIMITCDKKLPLAGIQKAIEVIKKRMNPKCEYIITTDFADVDGCAVTVIAAE